MALRWTFESDGAGSSLNQLTTHHSFQVEVPGQDGSAGFSLLWLKVGVRGHAR